MKKELLIIISEELPSGTLKQAVRTVSFEELDCIPEDQRRGFIGHEFEIVEHVFNNLKG
jgi:hypothetical protein